METYVIEIAAEGMTRRAAEKIATGLAKAHGVTAKVKTPPQARTRTERLSIAIGKIEDGMADLDDLSAELSDQLDAMPSGLKADKLRQAQIQIDAASADANRAIEEAQEARFPK